MGLIIDIPVEISEIAADNSDIYVASFGVGPSCTGAKENDLVDIIFFEKEIISFNTLSGIL